MGKKAKALGVFDKYVYYEKSVQNFEQEIDFLNEKYEEIRGKKPLSFREDFCGTAGVAYLWAAQSPDHVSYGVDLDPEPLEYGKEKHLKNLSSNEQKRVHLQLADVLTAKTPKVDVLCAFNFSYFIFKQRDVLLSYFKKARQAVKDDGVFMLDVFGGPESMQQLEEITEHKNFDYYWDCQHFNPLSNECRFAIHFKRNGEKKRQNVFTYDWRMWSIPELKEILVEAGFSKVITYWEGEDGEGSGNGEFFPATTVENCDAWVVYLAACP